MHVVPAHTLAVSVLLLLELATIAGIGLVTTRHRRAHLLVGLLLALLSGIWLLVDGPVEGPTLWVASRGHGLTVADLLAVPSLAVASVSLITSRRHRPTPPSVSEVAKRRALARLA